MCLKDYDALYEKYTTLQGTAKDVVEGWNEVPEQLRCQVSHCHPFSGPMVKLIVLVRKEKEYVP